MFYLPFLEPVGVKTYGFFSYALRGQRYVKSFRLSTPYAPRKRGRVYYKITISKGETKMAKLNKEKFTFNGIEWEVISKDSGEFPIETDESKELLERVIHVTDYYKRI